MVASLPCQFISIGYCQAYMGVGLILRSISIGYYQAYMGVGLPLRSIRLGYRGYFTPTTTT